ncbi:MAG: hypothetical protein DSM106950_18910 [Stigonema ocellatum SAG 48.90 = DSM 106950]|nr:hypothetical protein [Stigonema ocellatum SAG 48.90 = DSM 106950]
MGSGGRGEEGGRGRGGERVFLSFIGGVVPPVGRFQETHIPPTPPHPHTPTPPN